MFRWGILGSGFAARKFVLGLRQSKKGLAAAVWSRTAAHAESFARDFGIPRLLNGLNPTEMDGLDAVYIATPPTVHRSHAEACFAAGKPVLIEKPFAASCEDARAIAAAAASCGVFCMEGMWTRFLPAATGMRALLREKMIGMPRSLQASFGNANVPVRTDNQFDPALGGGALLHRAIYPLSMAIDLLGPAELVSAATTQGPTGVDEDCVLVLRHVAGALSTLRASLRATLSNDLSIEGDRGTLRLAAPLYRPFRVEFISSEPVSRGGFRSPTIESIREGGFAQGAQQRFGGLVRTFASRKRARIYTYRGNGYHYEADEVMDCVLRGAKQSGRMPLSQSIDMLSIIDQARSYSLIGMGERP